MKELEKALIKKFEGQILSEVFAKQLSLITGHFKDHKTLDWETCLIYLKEGMK